MRIVLHAGLHKTGTTSVQANWRRAYGEPGRVWYPVRGDGSGAPGHHQAVWPLLESYRDASDADLAWVRSLDRGSRGADLSDLIARAQRMGVETLLISAETLDRLRPADVPVFDELLRGHESTFLLTVTRPIQRWCSGWQTLVKHGLADYPRDAARHVLTYTCLRPGRVEELMGMLAVSRRVVRVVRTSPHEEFLARDLAQAVDVPWPAGDDDQLEVRNVSIGADVEVLRRLNVADRGLGMVEKGGGRRLRSAVRSSSGEREVPGLADRYALPESFYEGAERERAFLANGAAAAGVEVIDPHGQLASWPDFTPASWYSQIAEREAVIDGLDEDLDPAEQLWRVRQERSALRIRLQRAEQRLAELTAAPVDPAVSSDALPGRSRRRLRG